MLYAKSKNLDQSTLLIAVSKYFSMTVSLILMMWINFQERQLLQNCFASLLKRGLL